MLKLIKSVLLCISLLSLSACVALLTPKVESNFGSLKAGGYQLDKTHATLLFKVNHLGLSTYVGRFNDFDASLEFDPENMSAAKLNALIEMSSLDINNASLAGELQSKTWFNSASFPQAKFTSTSVRPISDSEFEFSGTLDWRGVAKPISVNASFNGGAFNMLTQKYTLGFTARTSFKRSDFGMDAYLPLVGDEVSIEAFVEFQRQ